jgi:hypothetical protein
METSQVRGWKEKVVAPIGPRVKALSAKTVTQLRVNPAKWTGIAAGSGLAIGLLGRFLHHRARHRAHQGAPSIVIIEAAC